MAVIQLGKWATPEDKNINYLETRYQFEKRQKLYIANEETNQVFDETDIPDVISAWNNNWSTAEIADYLGLDRQEIELLIIDLIHQGKIAGNIHIFKNKRKGKSIVYEINVGETRIRTIQQDKHKWICLKDAWKHIGKPEHSYRKVVENWSPSLRAKFKLHTPGGPQNFIFLNYDGLSKLELHVEKNMLSEIYVLKELIK